MKPGTALLASILMISIIIVDKSHADQASPDYQSHASILTAVEQFLQQQLPPSEHTRAEIEVGHLDNRLQLDACQQPLEAFFAPGSKPAGKTTVGVRCNDSKPWSIYVSGMVNLYTQVYAASAPLAKGHIINESDIIAVEANLAKLSYGYFTDKSRLVGQQTRRQLQQNQIIKPGQVKARLMVKRGQQVGLIAKSDNFSVKMSGKALMDGAKGDRISVKNLSSNRIIEGIVTQAGEVTVYN